MSKFPWGEEKTMGDAPLAARLREARRAMAYSHSDVADALGVDRSAVVDWETGRSEPSALQLAILGSKVFFIDPLRFLVDEPIRTEDVGTPEGRMLKRAALRAVGGKT